MFSRPLFRLDEERRQHAVMWVDGDLTSVLLKATTYPPSLGLVRNPRGLGIRVPAGLRSEAYQALMGKSPPPPIHYYEVAGVPLPMATNDLVGVLQTEGWLVKPVRSFLRRGARVWVVAAEQTPPQHGCPSAMEACTKPSFPSASWNLEKSRCCSFSVCTPSPAGDAPPTYAVQGWWRVVFGRRVRHG